METVAARWFPGLGFGLVLWMGAVLPAPAAEGTFRVGVRVLAAPAATAGMLDAVPMPTGAMRLTRGVAQDSYWFAGSAEDAAAHFHRAMPGHGYRLVQASADARTFTWTDAARRIEVRLQPVLGEAASTRILVQASPTS